MVEKTSLSRSGNTRRRTGVRRVGRVEASGILPGAAFHSDVLPNAAAGRERYFAEAARSMRGADLVFFDPDNGLEVPSVPYGRKRSSKYLYWREAEAAYERGHSVLLYQHFRREERGPFIARLATDVLAFRTPHVVFFLASQPVHAAALRRRATEVTELWRGAGIDLHPTPSL